MLQRVFAFFLLAAGVAAAQSATGTVDGTLRDPSGAVVPGAKVTLAEVSTGLERSTTSSHTGDFRILSVPTGNFRITIQAKGFKSGVAEFKLDVAGLQTIHMTLEVGQTTEVVQVSGAVQAVNTEEGTLSGVVHEEQIVNLPLNGRDVFALEALQPGVTQALTASIANFRATDSGIGWTQGKLSYNAAGHSVQSNSYTLDGLSNNNTIYGGKPGVTPSLDMVQEFRIQENNFMVEYGRNSGAIINVVTKTGTNHLHGSAYWFLRHDLLDARTVFDGPAIAPLRQSQAGFTLGGPIVRNRTFFFWGFEGYHQFRGTSQAGAFETPEFRDLIHRLYPGATQDKLFQQVLGPTPTSGLRDIGSPSTAYATPGPRDGINDLGVANYTTTALTTFHQYNLRLDHRFSERNQMFWRATWGPLAADPSDPRGTVFGLGEAGYQTQTVLGDTHVFSQRAVNEFRYGFTRNRLSDYFLRDDVPRTAINNNLGGDGITGMRNAGGYPSDNIGNEYSLADTFSINLGAHALKLGYEHHWAQDDGDRKTSTQGDFTFRGLMDYAAGFADTLTIRVDPSQVGGTPRIVGTNRDFRQQDDGLFGQDNWKITRRLALNFGLRWDRYGEIGERRNRLSNVVLGAGRDVFEQIANAKAVRVARLIEPNNKLFAPRFGFAWDVFGKGRTSMRGGYGLAYDRNQFLVPRAIRFNPPDSASLGLQTRTLAGPLGVSQTEFARYLGQSLTVPVELPAGTAALGFNPGGGPLMSLTLNGRSTAIAVPTGVVGLDPKMRVSYAQNWFLAVQQELPRKTIVEAAYAGNAGRRLPLPPDYNRFNGDAFGLPHPYTGAAAGDTSANRLNPYLSAVTWYTFDANSSYHGGFVSVWRRFQHGLSFQSSLTVGKVIDEGTVGVPDRRERGLAVFDVSRRWVSNFVYEIPFKRHGVMGALFSGWQWQGIITLQSGTPYTAQTSSLTYDFNGDGSGGDRPNAPGGKFNGLHRQQYLSGVFGADVRAAQQLFLGGAIPGDCDGDGRPGGPRGVASLNGRPCFAEGDLGRNTFRGPGYAGADTSIFKYFPARVLGEGARLQFRAEAFNVANRVNLQQVDANFESATFGRSTTAFPARQLQFALKLSF